MLSELDKKMWEHIIIELLIDLQEYHFYLFFPLYTAIHYAHEFVVIYCHAQFKRYSALRKNTPDFMKLKYTI